MVLEEGALRFQRFVDRLLGIDIALTTIDNGDVAETKRDNTSSQNVYDIRSSIPRRSINIAISLLNKRETPKTHNNHRLQFERT
jgi:hypothetical protein